MRRRGWRPPCQGGQLRQEEIPLEDEAHARVAQPRLGAPVEVVDGSLLEQDAAALGPFQAGERVEQRRLARAGRAHEEGRLARGDFQGDATQDFQFALADGERLAQIARADDRRGGGNGVRRVDAGT